jgi:hypothetical protein
MGALSFETNYTLHSEWSPKAPEGISSLTGWVWFRARCLACPSKPFLQWMSTQAGAELEVTSHLQTQHGEVAVD